MLCRLVLCCCTANVLTALSATPINGIVSLNGDGGVVTLSPTVAARCTHVLNPTCRAHLTVLSTRFQPSGPLPLEPRHVRSFKYLSVAFRALLQDGSLTSRAYHTLVPFPCLAPHSPAAVCAACVLCQGGESSRLSVIWGMLDDDHDGYISATELEEWFRDEAFIDNRLFSPHLNGVTNLHQLALSFLRTVDRDRDDRLSYDDLKAYCDGMNEAEIDDLAQSMLSVNEDKKHKAVSKVFAAIDQQGKGYWNEEDAERFIQCEAVYQAKRGATVEECEAGVRDMRSRLVPAPADGAARSERLVTVDQLCDFFASWPLREIRKHTEELVSSAIAKQRAITLQVIKQRRISRSDNSSGPGSGRSMSRSRMGSAGEESEMLEGILQSLSPREVDETNEVEDGSREQLHVNFVPSGSTNEPVHVSIEPSNSLAPSPPPALAISMPPMSLSDLLQQMVVLYDEIASLNAQQREMNDEWRRLDDRLVVIDNSRVNITQTLNDIQTELTAAHQKHVNTTKQRNNNEDKLKNILKRYEEIAEEGHRLAREIELCRETRVSMRAEVEALANMAKQLPEHSKVIERSVAEEKAKLEAATKAQNDAKAMIAMLQLELTAQERANGGGGGPALTRLRGKLAGYKKVEKEKGDEMKVSSEALRRWEDEKEGDKVIGDINSKMALYKHSLQEKKDQLTSLQREYDAQQKEQNALDGERRALYNDIINSKKGEQSINKRIQQLSENYAQGDAHVAQLGRERDEIVKRMKVVGAVQERVDGRLNEALMELELLCDDVVKAKEEEDEDRRREEEMARVEEGRYKAEMEVKQANGWEPDSTFVPPVPYVKPEERPLPWCVPVWIEAGEKRVRAVVQVNRYLLTVDNIVAIRQRKEDTLRVCVDVSEIIDLKLKAADETGQPTLTLKRMPSPVKSPPAAATSPSIKSASGNSSRRASTGSERMTAAALPIALPVSPRKREAALQALPIAQPTLTPTTTAVASAGATAPSSSSSTPTPTSASTAASPDALTASSSTSATSLAVASTSTASLINHAFQVTSSLLDTVIGPVSEVVTNAASAVTHAASAALYNETGGAASSSTPSSSSTSSGLPSPLAITASQSFTGVQPFSPAVSPSVLQPALRRQLSLAARQISLTLRPGYRNRFLVAVDSDKALLSHSNSNTTSSSSASAAAAVNKLLISADETHLHFLFASLRLSLHARRRKSFSTLSSASSPTSASATSSPLTSPATTPTSRTSNPLLAAHPVSKPKESFADRQARKKKRREKKERELKHQKELREMSEEVYIEQQSEILPLPFLQRLVQATPARYHLSVWSCVYSMTRDGVSLSALMAAMDGKECGIVVMRDMGGKTFGGFVSGGFISNAQAFNSYYGTGECFVWDVRDKTDEEKAWEQSQSDSEQKTDESSHSFTTATLSATPPSSSTLSSASSTVSRTPVSLNSDQHVVIYRWSGLNDHFMFTGADPPFIAMGGGGAFAWRVDHFMRHGSSGECSTYQSPQLSSTRDFELLMLEVWVPTRSKF